MMGNSVEWRHYSGRLLCNKRRAGISEVAHVLSAGNSFPLCVILFFPPIHFFLPAPALLLIILPTHAHTVPDTCLKGFAQPRHPFHILHFTLLLCFTCQSFFFFSRDIYRTIFRSPGQFPRRPLKINPALRPVEALRTYVHLAIRCEWN